MKTLGQRFESWGDWVNVASFEGKDYGTNGPFSSDWSGNATYKECASMAREGWPEGAEKVKAISERIGEILTSTIEQTIFNHAVVGHNLDVGAYLAGSPECFTSPEPLKIDLQGTRLVKMVVSGCCSSTRTSLEYQTRGAAIVAMIQALELNGYSLEVWLNFAAMDRRTDTLIGLDVKLKDFGDALDLDRVTFATVHTGHFRRLVFGQIEKTIGMTCAPLSPRDAQNKGDIYIGTDDGEYSDEAEAAEWVKGKLAGIQGQN